MLVTLLFVISFAVNFAAITVALPTIINTYQRYSRGKLVQCPAKQQQATILVSPKIAALSAVLIPKEIRIVKACSLWPYAECTKLCTTQIR